MKIEFEVSDYLNEKEIKKCIMAGIVRSIDGFMANEDNFERVMSNLAYKIIWDGIDELMKEKEVDLKSMLEGKVINIIDKLSVFEVFNTGGWGSKRTYGMDMIDETLKAKKTLIEEKVEQLINEYSINTNNFKDDIKDVVEEQILKCLGISEAE